jgi:hypothetical protein
VEAESRCGSDGPQRSLQPPVEGDGLVADAVDAATDRKEPPAVEPMLARAAQHAGARELSRVDDAVLVRGSLGDPDVNLGRWAGSRSTLTSHVMANVDLGRRDVASGHRARFPPPPPRRRR